MPRLILGYITNMQFASPVHSSPQAPADAVSQAAHASHSHLLSLPEDYGRKCYSVSSSGQTDVGGGDLELMVRRAGSRWRPTQS